MNSLGALDSRDLDALESPSYHLESDTDVSIKLSSTQLNHIFSLIEFLDRYIREGARIDEANHRLSAEDKDRVVGVLQGNALVFNAIIEQLAVDKANRSDVQ